MPRRPRTIADVVDLAFEAIADALFPEPPREPRAPKVKQPKVAKARAERQGPTLYDELEVSPHASAETIRAAYLSLSKRFHPDLNRQKSAAQRMKKINAAWEVLSDAEKRKEYDLRCTG